jgi:hypothetical protein
LDERTTRFMKPGISEFSYGYAVTEALVKGSAALTAAPVFPSLIAEGKKGGGWDLKLSFAGFIVFIQFKLCDEMVRNSAKETNDGLTPPILRMHLRPGRYSKQHQMLLDLESSGEIVLYVAPRFSTEKEFNSHYLNGNIIVQSVLISPSDIGALDDKDHHVSFEKAGTVAIRYSKPHRLPSLPQNGLSRLEELRDRARPITEEVVMESVGHLISTARDAGFLYAIPRDSIQLPPLQQLAFISRAVFGLEPIFVLMRDNKARG